MSCCFISCLTCLRRSTSFLISLGRIPISRLKSGISGISSWSSSCYHRNNTVTVLTLFWALLSISVQCATGEHAHTPHSFYASCEPLSAQWWSRYWTPGWLRGTGCWSQAAAQTCHKNLQKKYSEGFQEPTNETPMRQNRPKKKKIQSYQLWDPAPNLQHRWPFSSACFSPQHLRLLLQPEEKQQNSQGCTDANRNCVTIFNFTVSSWVFLKEGLSGTM